ncbi:MAG: RagB/SusD family nutrient uptake outer membrane protein [Bacteroides stercoris]
MLVYHKGSLPTRMYPTHMLGTTQQKYFTVSTRMGKDNVGKDQGDQRRWWNFADYSYKTNDKTGKVQKNYLTDANLKSANLYGRTGNPGKWRAEYDPVRPWSRNNSSINFPVMRFSDVLLMFAEADNEINRSDTRRYQCNQSCPQAR